MDPRNLVLGLCAAGLLSGCGTPRDRGSEAQRAACSQRTDEVYLKQDRGLIYRQDQYATSTRDAPFAGAGLIGDTRGLSGQFARQTMVDDCIAGATAAAVPAGPAAGSGSPLISVAPPTSSSPLARPPR